jgi:hypothetical protein
MGDIEVKIGYDFDKVVNVKCGNINCINNLFNHIKEGVFGCNLKYVDIDNAGSCMNKEIKQKEETKVT